MKAEAVLYLLPNTLGGENFGETIPVLLSDYAGNFRLILVENPKTARRLLIGMGLKPKLNDYTMISIKEGLNDQVRESFAQSVRNGESIGLITDAGCPGIADPGQEVVDLAHLMGVKVKPLTGPSSVILSLMASGFNGQSFVFCGYLPKERKSRQKKIRELEDAVYQKSQTQIFIETPYRNDHLFQDLISVCQKKTRICLAVNISLPDEWIKVKRVDEWSGEIPDLNKKQCIFLIYK